MKKLIIVILALLISNLYAVELVRDPLTSANGKYTSLVQVLECEKDKKTYGEYRDYGYWSGGAWCGEVGEAGYWVWVYPKWYVWAKKSKPQNRFGKSSANGKYSNLIQKLQCKKDKKTYGEYQDYGYWSGGAWCGDVGKAGYWVWVYPNWYVWETKN